jgi:DNA mismatch repair protein MutL
MTHAADEAFRGLLTPSRYPVVVVFVDIDPSLVDVNVHPTKAEVKFSREGDIHHAVHRAIKEALSSTASMPAVSTAGTRPASSGHNGSPQYQAPLITPQEIDARAFHEALVARSQPPADPTDPFSWSPPEPAAVVEQMQAPNAIVSEPTPQPVIEPSPIVPETVSLANLRVVGQIRNTYILAEADDGLLLIDQHVAHERVLYEMMMLAEEKKPVDMQRLVVPGTISLGRRESLLVNQKLSDFKRVGFDLEWFGKDSFVLRAVPAKLSDKDYMGVLQDMIDELVDQTVARHLIAKQEHVLITAACKMAVKAGDPLSHEEMSKLLEDLLKTGNPFMCPHGRPVIVTLSDAEISRRFRR